MIILNKARKILGNTLLKRRKRNQRALFYKLGYLPLLKVFINTITPVILFLS